jgi:hypothetical protein
MSEKETALPSWRRWPPNCCETCTGWAPLPDERYVGRCNSSSSLNCGEKTDSRERCPAFIRRTGV